MSAQPMILTLIVAAFTIFAATLGGVSVWLWISPPKGQ